MSNTRQSAQHTCESKWRLPVVPSFCCIRHGLWQPLIRFPSCPRTLGPMAPKRNRKDAGSTITHVKNTKVKQQAQSITLTWLIV